MNGRRTNSKKAQQKVKKESIVYYVSAISLDKEYIMKLKWGNLKKQKTKCAYGMCMRTHACMHLHT